MGYYVYFVMNGGLPLYSPVYDVTEIPDLDDYIPYKSPTSEYSYEFGGWYYDAELTAQVIAGDPITANTALYALWIGTQRGGYSITFVANGGTPIPDDLTNQTAIPDPLPSISKTGLTFDAWRWGNSSTAVAVVPGEPIYADATIYAKWVADLYDITYNSNGGSAVSSNIGVTAFPSPLPTSTKAGSTFAGWWNHNLTLQYSAGQTINGSLTVYAKWSLNSYSVTYVANGGSPEPDPLTSQATLPTPLPTINKSGYVSGGWYYNSLFTSQALAGDQLVENVILYAKFTLATYTITYNLDGGTNSVSNPATYNIETATITLLNPSKAGYTFNGWFSDDELTTEVAEIVSGTTGNIVLYASFTLSETGYSITYEENGGSPAQTDLTNQNYLPSVLPALTKTNYVFVGWYYDTEFTLPANPSDLLSANVTLYAKFLSVSTPLKGRLDVTLSDNTIVQNSKRFPTGGAVYTGLATKVDKVADKSLVLDTEIAHLVALDTQAELDIKFGAKEDIANKGVANGYAPLNASGIVDPIYVPGAYTDYVEYATYANLPASGVEGTLYVVIADETSGGNTSTYRWTGSIYVNVTDKLSASEVKALYESNANTNAYTDIEKTKLTGIEALAEVNIVEGVKVDNVLLTPDVDRIVNVDLSGKVDKVEGEGLILDAEKALVATIPSISLKNGEQDKQIATIEENLRRVNNGEVSTTAVGERVVYLGKDVANAPLKVETEGLLLNAPQLVTNGDFSGGTTGWAFTNTQYQSVLTGKLIFKASSQYGRVSQTLLTPVVSNKYYYYAEVYTITTDINQVGLYYFDGIDNRLVQMYDHTYSGSIQKLSGLKIIGAGSTFNAPRIIDNRTSLWSEITVDNIQTYNISTLIANKQYSPLYSTTFDLMSDEQIKAQMDLWVQNGTLPNDLMGVDFNKRFTSVGKNLFDKTKYATNYAYKIKVKPSTAYVWSASTAYKTYDNQGVEVASDTGTTKTTSAYTYYIAFSEVANIDTFQLELGSTATTYVPFVKSEMYIAPNVKGYSYQGTKDLILYRDGKYYFVKYVNDDKDGLLATPITTEITAAGVLNGYENGTVCIENAVKDMAIYNSGFIITNDDYLISELETIVKVDKITGLQTVYSASNAVVAGDKLSFTHSSLANGDLVYITYKHLSPLMSNTTITFIDNKQVVLGTGTSAGKYFKITPSVVDGSIVWVATEV